MIEGSADLSQSKAKDQSYDPVSVFSQDLFSDVSQQTAYTPSIHEDMEKQVKDYSWVQCDSVDCQKWRKLPTEEVDKLNDKDQWLCRMNSDPEYNSCNAAEEDYSAYDRLAKKLGLKYVMSKLAEGSLVWAKMVGYCRWPAIVTRDPVSGYFFEVDYNGDPTVYHVEYLGKHHTHAWISASHISLYGHKEDASNDKFVKPKKTRGKRKLTMTPYKSKPVRKRYKNMLVNEATDEADKMLDLTEEQRLSQCKFRYVEKLTDQISERNDQKNEADFYAKKSFGKMSQNLIVHKFGDENKAENRISSDRKRRKDVSLDRKRRKVLLDKPQHLLDKRKKSKKIDEHCHHCGHISSEKIVLSDGESAELWHSVKHEPVDSNDIAIGMSGDAPPSGKHDINLLQSSNLNFSSSMMNKTKEEKFKFDLQMYKRNEKAFDHDLRRFMERNNMTLKKTPIWHNVPIGLFSLFLAVHERGGFLEVCCKRLWSAVYKELSDSHSSTSGHTAKIFYERNLYPYELYLSGKSFKQTVEKFSRKKKETSHLGVEHMNSQTAESDSQKSNDLEAMLDELEDYSNLCQIEVDLGETNQNSMDLFTTQKRLGIDVKFHDDSTPEENFSPGIKIADTASEFGNAKSPGGSAQRVPNVMFSSTSGSSHGMQILHEMQALEQNLAVLDGDDISL